MGYQTSHELTMVKGSNDLISELREFSEEASYAIADNGDTGGQCKWYRHRDEMVAFSKLHPNELFKLSGEGEQAGDIWDEYYKNGKIQICNAVITKPNFNSELLEDYLP